MKGISLSRLFYRNVVRPWLGGAFPSLRHDAGIFGYGSELLGFDDKMSRDHNWGPRVQLVVTGAGSVDQITDATPLIVAPERARQATSALLCQWRQGLR